MAAQPDTDMRSRSLEERVSRIEGGFEHVATKADIERVLTRIERVRMESRVENERLRAEFQAELERSRTEFQTELERSRTESRVENERLRAEFQTESERNRTEIERNRADIIKIMIRLAGVGIALMALGFAFLRFTGTG